LSWQQWGAYAMKNGNHSICKVSVKGVMQYELWQIRPPLQLANRLHSFDDAKKVYESLKSS
jgi:hypothetical protein